MPGIYRLSSDLLLKEIESCMKLGIYTFDIFPNLVEKLKDNLYMMKGGGGNSAVFIGSDGVTEGVIGAVTQALKDHELIKVKIAEEDREGRAASVQKLAEGSQSEVAQTMGRTVLLFKQKKKNSKIALVT